jgi:D-lactate dehydrogenase
MSIQNFQLDKRQILNSDIHKLAFASDASFYRIVPESVVEPINEIDIISLFNYCKSNRKHLTFRASGTSLSGQSVTDGILVDLSRYQKKLLIHENGEYVNCSPNIIAGKINNKLKKFDRILGPDPASISACTIGGIVANNSSGMRSGIIGNAYNTIKSLRFILPNGHIVDTSDKTCSNNFKKFCPDIYQSIIDIRNEILNDSELSELIRRKHRIKSTVGYSLTAFLDYEDPSDILAHLMVGSEGTLGFISEISIKTFPDYKEKSTGIIFFKTVVDACKSILTIKSSGVSALEFLDYKSLKSIEQLAGEKFAISSLPEGSTALLFEFQEPTKDGINSKLEVLNKNIKNMEMAREAFLSDSPLEQEQIWKIRKGLLASLGASRKSGTTFILEDICIPIENFEYAIPDLQSLFIKHGYFDTGIYGHGMDGNVHFMLTENFEIVGNVLRYSGFMDDLAELVVRKHDGTLKAEHGTGRNIAPFVEFEWGEKAYNLMKRIKKLIDPDSILNQGVLINDDKKIHLKNFKSYPKIYDEADKCIECGFCEPVCPSKNFTLSPRKRIVIQREFERNQFLFSKNEIKSDYNFYSIDTCAVDGMCAEACPVGINTGDMIKCLRIDSHSSFEQKIALVVSRNFKMFEKVTGYLLKLFSLLTRVISIGKINSVIEFVFKLKIIPFKYTLNEFMGKPKKLKSTKVINAEYIYFPCCVSRMMGQPKNDKSLSEVIIELSEKARVSISIPDGISSYCCGTIFSSKGYDKAYQNSANKIIKWLWIESNHGEKPIIFDSTSCFQTIMKSQNSLSENNSQKWEKMYFVDSTEFIADTIIDKLKITKKSEKVVLHPTCSSVKLSIDNKLKLIAEKCSDVVVIPQNIGCCGMAGDRGMIYPELSKSATLDEMEELSGLEANGYYSSNITCEIGMSVSTGKKYRSIAYMVLDSIE